MVSGKAASKKNITRLYIVIFRRPIHLPLFS